jgi:hypothetical protein
MLGIDAQEVQSDRDSREASDADVKPHCLPQPSMQAAFPPHHLAQVIGRTCGHDRNCEEPTPMMPSAKSRSELSRLP